MAKERAHDHPPRVAPLYWEESRLLRDGKVTIDGLYAEAKALLCKGLDESLSLCRAGTILM